MAIDDVRELPQYDFGRGVAASFEKAFNELPQDVAKLVFLPGSAETRFSIQPSNPESASIRGVFEGDYFQGAYIYIVVGRGSDREILIPEKRLDAYESAIKTVSEICRAVFAGGFSEHVEFLTDSKIVRAGMDLSISGHPLRLGHALLHNPFRRTTKRTFTYKPYNAQ